MLRFILPSILWTIVVISLSLAPGSNVSFREFQFEHMDKIVHFTMYLFLTLFWSTGLKRQNISDFLTKKALLFSSVGGFSLGFILELMQEFLTESRSFDYLDLIANGIGCIFGIILFKIIYPETRKI